MPNPRSLLVLAGLSLALCVAGPRPAQADVEETAVPDELRLAEGQTVTYPQTLYKRSRRYVGGVTYTVINASSEELTQLLSDPTAYTQVLPHARTATLVGKVGDDQLVEIFQGNSLIQTAYTLRMRTEKEAGGGQRVRFWLDRSRPHGIDDAWGYFRVDPIEPNPDGSPRVLLSYGILVDLGPGIMRDFFESRIQSSMLSVPERLRQYASIRFRGHRA